MDNDNTPTLRVPVGKRTARVTFTDDSGECSVNICLKRPKKGTPATTVQMTLITGSTDDSVPKYNPGDKVAVYIEDDTIVSDYSNEASGTESEFEPTRAYGIVMSTAKTSVKVLWFYEKSEFPSVHPPNFARLVKQHTLSTKVSDNINIASIEKVENIPGVSECIYNVDTNRLEGSYHSMSVYYDTLSDIHAYADEQGCLFEKAVDWAITEKIGMFHIIGSIAPSEMTHALRLFEKSTKAPLPLEIGRLLLLVGQTPLTW